MISEYARSIIKNGEIKLRVKRSGMLQYLTFRVKRIEIGNEKFTELHADRLVDMSEVSRLADEIGLPVESQNCRAFPKGKGAKDFVNI